MQSCVLRSRKASKITESIIRTILIHMVNVVTTRNRSICFLPNEVSTEAPTPWSYFDKDTTIRTQPR
jgi:hypothetical protein